MADTEQHYAALQELNRNYIRSVDALTIFVFIVWFWLLITVATDLFRRHDISGWAKAIWVTPGNF